MKKILAIWIMLSLSNLIVYAAEQADTTKISTQDVLFQKDLDDELRQYYGDKHVDFTVSKQKIDALIWVDADNADNNDGILLVYDRQIPQLRAALLEVKAKWKEWIDVARDNNVRKVSKEIDVKFPKVIYGWILAGNIYARKRVPINFTFKYDDGDTKLISSYKVASANNRYVKSTYIFKFDSIEELNELIDILDEDNLQSIISHANKVRARDNELFK